MRWKNVPELMQLVPAMGGPELTEAADWLRGLVARTGGDLDSQGIFRNALAAVDARAAALCPVGVVVEAPAQPVEVQEPPAPPDEPFCPPPAPDDSQPPSTAFQGHKIEWDPSLDQTPEPVPMKSSEVNLDLLTRRQLRQVAQERGVGTSGSATVLRKRLRSHA